MEPLKKKSKARNRTNTESIIQEKSPEMGRICNSILGLHVWEQWPTITNSQDILWCLIWSLLVSSCLEQCVHSKCSNDWPNVLMLGKCIKHPLKCLQHVMILFPLTITCCIWPWMRLRLLLQVVMYWIVFSPSPKFMGWSPNPQCNYSWR